MKNKYLESRDKSTCNGCGICTIGCPTGAISMVEDEEGFYYPKIDGKKCIRCNKCKNICSNYNNSLGNEDVYMAINNNNEELKNSASGGMFFVLAKYIIKKNGVVFGVEYDENLKVQHNYYDNLQDCKKLQGSKYVRSNVRNSYGKVKELLEQNRWVLFTGTPCQCNALKTFLKKDYDSLIICDIICHANPSQKVFDKYIKEIEKRYNKKVIDIKFRDKTNGWKSSMPKIYFEDGTNINDKLFYLAFVKELFNRPSCHECVFSKSNRVTDFTMGDFWGVEKIMPQVKDDDMGISLFTVNSNKAKEIFKDINVNMKYSKVDKENAFLYNHNSNLQTHQKRQIFFDNLEKVSIIENIQSCIKVSLIKKFIAKGKKILKKIIIYKNG